MDENNSNPVQETQEQPSEQVTEQQAENISITDALTGVITAPADTYGSISSAPKKNYWLVPYLILVAASLISTFLFYHDEQLVGNLVDMQKQKIEESIEKSVQKGDMTREQGNEAIERAQNFSDPRKPLMQIIGYVSAVLVPVIFGLLLSLIYLIIMKIMKVDFDYLNILNVLSLSSIVLAVGSVLSIVVSILVGKLSGISPGLILNEESAGKFIYALLTKLDLFTIWYFILVAIGLSKIARIKSSSAYTIVFGVWLVYILLTSFLSSSF